MTETAIPHPIRIACVGASVTFGRGLKNRREESYPAVLQRLLDESLGAGECLVKNLGYSGATVTQGSNEPYWRTPSFTAATRFEPHLALVMLGTNDAQYANATAREAFAGDLVDLIQHFRSLSAEVLVADPPPAFPPVAEIDFESLHEAIRPTIRRVAAEQGTPLVDFLTPLADQRDEFPDGLHPTAIVAARIAEIACQAITPRLTALRLS